MITNEISVANDPRRRPAKTFGRERKVFGAREAKFAAQKISPRSVTGANWVAALSADADILNTHATIVSKGQIASHDHHHGRHTHHDRSQPSAHDARFNRPPVSPLRYV